MFNGVTIPAESDMVLSIYGIQRDEGTWQDAEVFRPSRFLDSWPRHGFIPFGLGRHICIGSRFSILESILILACVGQRFRLAQADQEEVNPEAGVNLLPDRAIRLQIEPLA
jgi:cytochrome P450